MKITVGLLRAAAEFAEDFECGGKRYDGVAFQDGYIIGASKGAMLYAPVAAIDKPFFIHRGDLDRLLKVTDSMKNTDMLDFIWDGPTVIVVNEGSEMLWRNYPLMRLLPKESVSRIVGLKFSSERVRPDQAYDLLLLSKIAIAAGYLGYGGCPAIHFCDKTNTAKTFWLCGSQWVGCVVAGLQRTEETDPLDFS